MCWAVGRRRFIIEPLSGKDAASWRETGDGTAPLLRSVLGARCPRCSHGRLYAGFLALNPACAKCGLDFSPIDTGDGPAVLVVLVAGAIVAGAALYVEFTYAPPYWLHAAIWLPVTLLLTLGLLRPFKSLLIAMQYRHKAAEGRHEQR